MRNRLTLLLSPLAPRQARRSFDRYADTVDASLLDDLRLATSELVTNAVLHSGCPDGDEISLTTTISDHLIRTEVGDGGPGAERMRPRSADPPSGLGYVERLADRWSSSFVGSFRVWFEVDVTPSKDGVLRRTHAPQRT